MDEFKIILNAIDFLLERATRHSDPAVIKQADAHRERLKGLTAQFEEGRSEFQPGSESGSIANDPAQNH